jgi:hypothetical protein
MTGTRPLSDWTARFTDDRAHNFNVYLPKWLAEHNRVILGVLFVVGELIVLECWLKERYARSARQTSG